MRVCAGEVVLHQDCDLQSSDDENAVSKIRIHCRSVNQSITSKCYVKVLSYHQNTCSQMTGVLDTTRHLRRNISAAFGLTVTLFVSLNSSYPTSDTINVVAKPPFLAKLLLKRK